MPITCMRFIRDDTFMRIRESAPFLKGRNGVLERQAVRLTVPESGSSVQRRAMRFGRWSRPTR